MSRQPRPATMAFLSTVESLDGESTDRAEEVGSGGSGIGTEVTSGCAADHPTARAILRPNGPCAQSTGPWVDEARIVRCPALPFDDSGHGLVGGRLPCRHGPDALARDEARLLRPPVGHGPRRGPGAAVHNVVSSDQIQQFLPWTDIAWKSVHQGHLPLWNPFNAMGVPLAFNMQSGTFSLPMLVAYLVPLRFAYTTFVLVKIVLAGTGMLFFSG